MDKISIKDILKRTKELSYLSIGTQIVGYVDLDILKLGNFNVTLPFSG